MSDVVKMKLFKILKDVNGPKFLISAGSLKELKEKGRASVLTLYLLYTYLFCMHDMMLWYAKALLLIFKQDNKQKDLCQFFFSCKSS